MIIGFTMILLPHILHTLPQILDISESMSESVPLSPDQSITAEVENPQDHRLFAKKDNQPQPNEDVFVSENAKKTHGPDIAEAEVKPNPSPRQEPSIGSSSDFTALLITGIISLGLGLLVWGAVRKSKFSSHSSKSVDLALEKINEKK